MCSSFFVATKLAVRGNKVKITVTLTYSCCQRDSMQFQSNSQYHNRCRGRQIENQAPRIWKDFGNGRARWNNNHSLSIKYLLEKKWGRWNKYKNSQNCWNVSLGGLPRPPGQIISVPNLSDQILAFGYSGKFKKFGSDPTTDFCNFETVFSRFWLLPSSASIKTCQ